MARKRTLINLPMIALTDKSLRPRDLQVLGALEYFCDRSTGLSSPERQKIADLIDARREHVSRSMRTLETSGWIERRQVSRRNQPAVYFLTWFTITEDCSNCGATHGTQKGLNGVPHMAPHYTDLDATHGTPSSDLDATHGTPSSDLDATHGTPSSDQRVHAHADSNYLNIYINNRSDRSDPTRVGETENSKFGLTDAIEILVSFGTPNNFVREPEDRQIIASWIQAGVDAAWLTEVCETATERKRDGKPFGPKYVNLVMQSMAEEGKSAVGQEFSKTDYKKSW